MPASLHFDQYLAALESAGGRLCNLAVEAGMDAAVPTCPAWTIRSLVAHQAMVHRWSAAQVLHENPDDVPNQTDIRTSVDDLIGYYSDGLQALIAALRAAPPDLQAMTFLNDAPPPRDVWARRQAHETTIHMVDALSAALARFPTTAEAGIEPALAADGIDELVCGFFTRGRSKLFEGTAFDVVVAPTDVARRWLLHVGEKLTVGNPDALPDGATTLSGTAAGLYLALWNRGADIEVAGDSSLLEHWRTKQRVQWS